MPAETYRASTADAIASEGERGFVAVADASQLREGETLRADIDGIVITIAKVDGQLYGFQEFCTHRYGPLSEGVLKGIVIEWPWHRSCFDVRSGKVTQGPAKVDLKTYPVKIVDDKISVGVARPASEKENTKVNDRATQAAEPKTIA
jgi:nitrite reductase/ring-hydroxylating ferredoxin subunit